MSIRAKVFLVIIGIVAVITASSVIISITSAQSQILKTLEKDMDLVASLADEYVSAEITVLKESAAAVAQMLNTTGPEDMLQALIEQVAANASFTAITIFNESRKIEASYGNATAPESIAQGEYGLQAFQGKSVISTTHKTPSGFVVFYVLAPLDDYYYYQTIIGESVSQPKIIACTVRGDHFSQLVSRFLIWETGNILLGDNEGTILANINHDWVVQQRNFLEITNNDAAASVMRRMANGESAAGRIIFDDLDAVIAFRPITASMDAWSLAIIAPIEESPFIYVRKLIAISGTIFFFLGLVAAIFASGFIARPFYQIEEQNADLLRLGKVAESASKTKSVFLANMSSSMRTPLCTIIGLAETNLKKEGLQKDLGTCFEKISETGVALLAVVDNLLDISSMETDKFKLVPGEYDVEKLITDLVSANRIHIGPRPVTFNLVLDKNIPARLNGDAFRVKQIFNTLLSNALSYTNQGSVEWRISSERDGNSVWLLSTISDTGVGISHENISKLFTEYSNLSAHEGAGLDLPLAKKLVNLMGGTITAESIGGRGTVFTVKLRQNYVDDLVINT